MTVSLNLSFTVSGGGGGSSPVVGTTLGAYKNNTFSFLTANINLLVGTASGARNYIGKLSATNNPTSWAISAVSPVSAASWFSIDNSGALWLTPAGVTGANQTPCVLTVQAANASGSGSGSVALRPLPDATVAGSTGTLTSAGGGVTLTAGTYTSKHYTSGITLDCSAGNVTLNNCQVDGGGAVQCVYTQGGGNAVSSLPQITLNNCTLKGDSASGPGEQRGITPEMTNSFSYGPVINVNNCYIYNVGAACQVQHCQGINFNGCFIHVSLATAASGSHVDGLYINGAPCYQAPFTANWTHNTIINGMPPGQTDCIFLSCHWSWLPSGSQTLNISDNALLGGGYTVYINGQAGNTPPSGITMGYNVLLKGQYGYYNNALWTSDSTSHFAQNVDYITGVEQVGTLN